MNQSVFSLDAVFVLLIAYVTAIGSKQFTIRPFSLLQFTGNPVNDFRQCKAAEQMVFDMLKNQTDILPEYHLQVDFLDEGPLSMNTLKAAIPHVDRMLDDERNTSTGYFAPISLGPLATPGCKAWGSSASHMNMVMIGFSCTAVSQTDNRKMYPNMYRIRSSAQVAITARVHLMKSLNPSWKRIGILMNMNTNSFNIEAAAFSYKIAVQNGFQIVAIEATPDFSEELMTSLKNKNIRIFMMESAEQVGASMMLCNAYKAGIRGSRYLFFMNQVTFAAPATAEINVEGCSREIYAEQLKMAIFVGASEMLLSDKVKSSIEHTVPQFDLQFLKLINFTRKPDYMFRYLCYDAALHLAISLHETEKSLNLVNLTLRDFAAHSREVMLVANQTLRDIKLSHIRFGDFKYSERGEVDYEPQLAMQFDQKMGPVVRYRITLSPNATYDNLNGYVIEPIAPFRVQMPLDSPLFNVVDGEVSLALFSVIVVLAVTASVLELLLILKRSYRNPRNLKDEGAVLALSVCLINAASVLFASTSRSQSTVICTVNVLLSVMGISLMHAFIGLKLKAAYEALKSKALQEIETSIGMATFGTQRSNRAARSAAGRSVKNRLERIPSAEVLPNDCSNLKLYSALFCFVNVILFLVWEVFDPIVATLETTDFSANFDQSSDTYTSIKTLTCRSRSAGAWLASLLVVNLIPVVFSVVIVVKIRGFKALRHYPDVQRLIVAVPCSATLFSQQPLLWFYRRQA